MKKLFLLIGIAIFCTGTLMAQADAISKYFDKYADDERFSTVYISPAMFEMAADIDSDNMKKETKQMLSKLKGIRILTSEKVNGTEFFKEAISTIETDRYEVFMEVRDGDENVKFMSRKEDNEVKEILMLVGEPDEFVMISFIGSVGPEDLSKLGDTFNFNMGGMNLPGNDSQEGKENN